MNNTQQCILSYRDLLNSVHTQSKTGIIFNLCRLQGYENVQPHYVYQVGEDHHGISTVSHKHTNIFC